jgi:hypothetical protein
MSDLLQYVEWTSEATTPPATGRLFIYKSIDAVLTKHRKAISNAYGITERTPYFFYLWHRLWMDSPLSCERMVVLRDAFADYSPNQWEKDGHLAFLAALDSSIQAGLAMNVSLSPPGHVDFGRKTIFPHCPKCKLELGRFYSAPNDDGSHECDLCGTEFKPSSTFSSGPCEYPSKTAG